VARLGLADQESIAAFVQPWDGPPHLLINNAGIMRSPEQRTPEGWELQFATNHLGHFRSPTDCTTRSPPPGLRRRASHRRRQLEHAAPFCGRIAPLASWVPLGIM
jgi:NAD(P)-dependent dehydrogenase (short-subunit alcohol dehydrogenase family)